MTVVMLASCSESTFEEGNNDRGYDYQPLALGSEWVYQIDSTMYADEGATVYESSGFLKEALTATIDEDHYVLTQSYRKDSDAPWVITDVHSVQLTSDQFYRTEFNRRFAKLVFPVRDGRSWDGNASFDDRVEVDVFGSLLRIYEGWDYDMTAVDGAVTVLDKTYDDVIEVLHIDREDNITRSYSKEQYARGVGMISSSHTYLETQRTQSTAPWTEKADKGLIIEKRLVSQQ